MCRGITVHEQARPDIRVAIGKKSSAGTLHALCKSPSGRDADASCDVVVEPWHVIPLTVIGDGDVRVAFCMCAGTASDVRSVECGRATVMRRVVGLSVSNLPAMTTHHFSVVLVFGLLAFAPSFLNMVVFAFAFGLSFPLHLSRSSTSMWSS